MLNETERYRDTTDGLLDVTLSHVGKTGHCLYTKVKEHSCHDSSEIYIQSYLQLKRIQL